MLADNNIPRIMVTMFLGLLYNMDREVGPWKMAFFLGPT